MQRVELSKRAQRDLRRLQGKSRERVIGVLEEELAADPQPENLDIKPLKGRTPWLRLRSGDYRVLYRPLTTKELRALKARERKGFLVERVVDRRELERAAARLPVGTARRGRRRGPS